MRPASASRPTTRTPRSGPSRTRTSPGERVYAVAGAAFAVDTCLKSDANGKLIAAAAGDNAIAKSLEAAGADLDIVCVEILPLIAARACRTPSAAGGFKVARGEQLTVPRPDTIVTGLATVVAVSPVLETRTGGSNITISAAARATRPARRRRARSSSRRGSRRRCRRHAGRRHGLRQEGELDRDRHVTPTAPPLMTSRCAANGHVAAPHPTEEEIRPWLIA
jgi:hypothetical protein